LYDDPVDPVDPASAVACPSTHDRRMDADVYARGPIIDERFNAGGQMADYIIEVMSRHIEAYWSLRYGTVEHTPNAAIYGPKVMIANEVSGEIPVLMDGAHVTSPSVAFFSPKGEWDVENHGVDPDVVVEQDPKAVSEGHDPQLEAAVAIALRELATHPFVEPARPAFPDYHH